MVNKKAWQDQRERFFMSQALKEASDAFHSGDIPVGCVLVDNGKIISRTCNQKEKANSPLAHAELIAIQEGLQKKNSKYLEGCDLYVTLEPCLMCMGAIIQSRIDRIIFAAPSPKGGAAVSSLDIRSVNGINHHPEIIQGVMQESASRMLKQFFKEKRKKKHEL